MDRILMTGGRCLRWAGFALLLVSAVGIMGDACFADDPTLPVGGGGGGGGGQFVQCQHSVEDCVATNHQCICYTTPDNCGPSFNYTAFTCCPPG